jgi:hypothetical protein
MRKKRFWRNDMVDIELDTDELVWIEKSLDDYFNGEKSPRHTKKSLEIRKRLNFIRIEFQKIDAEIKAEEDRE